MDIDKILEHLWQEIQSDASGEPNLLDVSLIAQVLRLHYVDEMLQRTPNSKDGLKIVEHIEDALFKDPPGREIHHMIRNLSQDELSQRLKQLAKDLQIDGTLYGGLTKTLSAAFYTWYGCISMAKLTRVMGSDSVHYTPEMRSEQYNYLKSEWEEAEKYKNPWIKFGVSLAKQLEEKRKKTNTNKIIVDEWVPKESPYWNNIHEN